ncbi:hypothetical protein CBR_g89832, partial [Chara braunii]
MDDYPCDGWEQLRRIEARFISMEARIEGGLATITESLKKMSERISAVEKLQDEKKRASSLAPRYSDAVHCSPLDWYTVHLQEGSESVWKNHFEGRWGRILSQKARDMLVVSWYSDTNVHPKISHSSMAWYSMMEQGLYAFPAQVYNKERGRGKSFCLSAHDVRVRYNPASDTFTIDYDIKGRGGRGGGGGGGGGGVGLLVGNGGNTGGKCGIEEGVPWERIRSSPVDIDDPYKVYVSDDLRLAQPDDQIEIQLRMSKDLSLIHI